MIAEVLLGDVLPGDVISEYQSAYDNKWYGFERTVVLVDGERHLTFTGVADSWCQENLTSYLAQFRLLVRVDRVMGVDLARFPHACRRCRAPAYYGATPAAFECSASCSAGR